MFAAKNRRAARGNGSTLFWKNIMGNRLQ